MALGETIQKKRNEQGMSQEQLAELVGVSRQAVSKWEVGDAIPDTDKLIPLAGALGISVDELLGNGPVQEAGFTSEMEGQRSGPGWLATHWYWLGWLFVTWGVVRLLQMAPTLFAFLQIAF